MRGIRTLEPMEAVMDKKKAANGMRNIANCSWGDHLIFGEGDGLLRSVESLERRMDAWREELGSGAVHWRQTRTGLDDVYQAARGYGRKKEDLYPPIRWDDFEAVPRLAHERGMTAYAYVTLFDHGHPLAPKAVREASHHNEYHGKNFARMSRLTKEHPEYVTEDRSGGKQWGVLCLAYPEAREYMIERYAAILAGYEWDGLFLCLRTQSRPADYADQYGFNPPIRRDFMERYGTDIRSQEFDIQAWRDLQGEYLTAFLRELREVLQAASVRLAVGCARGDVVGPPMSNAALQWRTWLREGIVDELIVDQSSSQCPSLWISLWPMHRGYGYTQNYLDEWNMPSLEDDLSQNYAPVVERSNADLYVAWQWKDRSPERESSALSHPEVAGLVYSTFRHDNPGPIARDDWRI